MIQATRHQDKHSDIPKSRSQMNHIQRMPRSRLDENVTSRLFSYFKSCGQSPLNNDHNVYLYDFQSLFVHGKYGVKKIRHLDKIRKKR